MNVYLIEDEGGGVTMYDAGIKEMTKPLKKACAQFGGLNRIVLGHGHVDHRGAAPGLDAPVFCHPDNVADTEGSGGRDYMKFKELPLHSRLVYPGLFKLWDGGPVKVTGTVEEGDDVSGFKVVLVDGHAPGQIALYRERDGMMLTSDLFYTLNPMTGLKGAPRVAHRAFTLNDEQARLAMKKAADLQPSSAWPGHADPILEDVKSALYRAAETR